MKQGYDNISIRTVDTDVVVLAVTSAQRLNITELWCAFGARKKLRYLPAHEIANALGLNRCATVYDWLCPLERLLVLMYDFGNGARKQFTQKGRAIVLRHKQYLSSTQSGLLTKPVNVGHRR